MVNSGGERLKIGNRLEIEAVVCEGRRVNVKVKMVAVTLLERLVVILENTVKINQKLYGVKNIIVKDNATEHSVADNKFVFFIFI